MDGWREEVTGEAESPHFTPERGLGRPQEEVCAVQSRRRTISFIVTWRSKLTEKFCVWLPAASSLLWTFGAHPMPLAFDTV